MELDYSQGPPQGCPYYTSTASLYGHFIQHTCHVQFHVIRQQGYLNLLSTTTTETSTRYANMPQITCLSLLRLVYNGPEGRGE